MANFAHLAFTPAQVYVDVLAFAQGKTLEDLIPDDQVVIGFRPPRKGAWYLRPFGVPGIAEIDMDEPRLILADRPKVTTLRHEAADRLVKAAMSHGFTREDAVTFLDALTQVVKEEVAQCAKK